MTRSCASGAAMNAIVLLLVTLLAPVTLCLPQVLPPRGDFGLFSREDFKYYQNSGGNRIDLGRIDPSSATSEAVDSSRSTLNPPTPSVFSTNQQQQLQFQSSRSSFSETTSTRSAIPSISTSPSSSAAETGATIAGVSGGPSTVQSNVTYSSTDVTPTANGSVNVSDTFVADNATEKEKVVMAPSEGIQSKISSYREIFQHTLVWLNDTYVLSILIPVCFGFVVASVVIVAMATCRCIRRRYLRRRLRSKVLPESIKNMRRSDRTRLLAESSDEEF